MTTNNGQRKAPPEGVSRTILCDLGHALGYEYSPSSDVTPKTAAGIEQFFTDPLCDTPSSEFDEVLDPSAYNQIYDPHQSSLLCLSLMTKKRKPIAALFVGNDDSSGKLVFVLRGDRRKLGSSGRLFRALPSHGRDTINALMQFVCVTSPKDPCNFHPWFSSIVLSVSGAFTHAGYGPTTLQRFKDRLRPVDPCTVKAICDAVHSGRVLVAVCPPSPVHVEHALHTLAIDKAADSITSEDAQNHKSAWLKMVAEQGIDKESNHSVFSSVHSMLSSLSQSNQSFTATCRPNVQAPPASGSKRTTVVAESSNAAAAGSKKPRVEEPCPMSSGKTAGQASNDKGKQKSEAAVRRDLSKASGKSKFLSETLECNDAEEAQEHLQTRAFENTLAKHKDSDEEGACGDESESDEHVVKKKKGRHLANSDDESELSGSDDDEDSEEEDSDDDDSSDGNSSDEDSEKSATSSSDEEKSARKYKRLVPASDAPDGTRTSPMVENSVSSSTAVVDYSNQEHKKRPPPAQGKRLLIAEQCIAMLDRIDACANIPIATSTKVLELTRELREGFSIYRSAKVPIKKTYTLLTTYAQLAMTAFDIIEQRQSAEDKSKDAVMTHRLAVANLKCMLTQKPHLDEIISSMGKGIKAVENMRTQLADATKEFERSVTHDSQE